LSGDRGVVERKRSPSKARRWLPFVVVTLIVGTAIFLADRGAARSLFVWTERHPGSDKVGHFALIGGLALALNYALRGRTLSLGIVAVQLGGVLVALAMTAEEISQAWIPARQFDFGDLLANYAGILCADWLARRWVR
jgi:polysaccharide biosynthesis protein VpsQ